MTTELVKAEPIATNLPDMVRYAEHLANANLLPAQYRQKPANVLYAMEYGRTLGITPLAAITGIHVIEGKPSASAALISGLVRQAGHKLRVTGNGLKATAQIIRSDDPDFTYEVTWELRQNADGNPNAQDAGLLNKDVWKKYAASMLKARAISQVARDACEEVLFGLHYTPEELNARVDADGIPMDAEVQQLRPAPAGEADQWATPAQPTPTQQTPPNVVAAGVADLPPESLTPAGRDYLHEAIAAPDAATVRLIWQDAKNEGAVPEYLGQIAEVGKQKAAAEAEVVDAEVVTDADDEHTAAVADLRAFAASVGLNDVDTDAYSALGVPLADASAASIRDLLNQIRGNAA